MIFFDVNQLLNVKQTNFANWINKTYSTIPRDVYPLYLDLFVYFGTDIDIITQLTIFGKNIR